MWLQRTFVQPHFANQPRRIVMKKLHALVLAGLVALTASVAFAEENAVTPARGAKSQPTAVATAAPAAPAKISQQDKMRLCAKQATGKKGVERKTFMKGCLSKKA